MSKRKSSSSTDLAATDSDPSGAGNDVALDDGTSRSAVASDPAPDSKSDSAMAKSSEAFEAEATTGTEDASPAESVTAVSENESAEPTGDAAAAATADAAEPPPAPARRRPWFGLFNFLLIVALTAAATYYWLERQKLDAAYQAEIGELRQQLNQKASSSQLRSDLQTDLKSSLSPFQGELGKLERKVDELGLGQQSLRESSETLYELFGRDRNDWQLAEVEYLMRVAQHQLILQDDFEGAAITLQAASDRIGLTGDPGLLPVRVQISEEIADLKTRKRPDLVGMTLILAQLGRQVRTLKPGFAVRVDQPIDTPSATNQVASGDWLRRFNVFLNSLISIRKESTQPSEIEANIIDVASALEDNLKLARWAVLERNSRQYQMLLERSLRLFREFYDLDDVANNDFLAQLQDLQKMVINPDKPDITGSLREMQRILSQRENAPTPAITPAAGDSNG